MKLAVFIDDYFYIMVANSFDNVCFFEVVMIAQNGNKSFLVLEQISFVDVDELKIVG